MSATDPRPPVPASAAAPARVFVDDAAAFAGRVNRSSFLFRHSLAEHPLFELPRIADLALKLWGTGKGLVTMKAGETTIGGGWTDMPGKSMSLVKAIRELPESGAWLMLKNVFLDPEYKELMDQGYRDLAELTGLDVARDASWPDAYVFIASPHSITPYHFDHESTFLLQIHGGKTYNIFDSSVLREEEIEAYYLGDLSSAHYREEAQAQAAVYELEPGLGVHQPPRSPHWVRNGPEYSVSFSILTCLREWDREAPVYQVNHHLRSLGLTPTPPGRSAWRDSVKRALLSTSARRNPASKNDLLRAGVERLAGPTAFLKKALGRGSR
jgi:hypothetical protein